MTIVPKGPRAEAAKVRNIDTAPSRGRGRPSGLGYDPSTGDEVLKATYHGDRGDGDEVFASYGKRGYSEDRFYTSATNEHNHGEKLNGIRIPQGIDSQVHAAVREVNEYRHVNDLVRDALLHRLEYLQKRYRLTPETHRMLQLERFAADRERRNREIHTNLETIEDLKVKLEDAWNAKDYRVFASELEEGKQMLEWMREPYHGEVVKILHHWSNVGRVELERMDREARE